MYIVLASGYRDRYLDEVVRALAIPAGAQMNFRYKKQWLTETVSANIDALIGEQCMIGYIKFTSSGSEVVPLRVGKIRNCMHNNQFVVVTVQVDEYVSLENFDSFQNTLKTCSEGIPQKKTDLGFFSYIPNRNCIKGIDIKNCYSYWENTVKKLKDYDDFQLRKYNFFKVDGIYPANKCICCDKKHLVKTIDGFFEFKSGEAYEIIVSFFDSIYKEASNNIAINSDHCIRFVSSNQMSFDTDYDTRSLKFVTNNFTGSSFGYLFIDSTEMGVVDSNKDKNKAYAGIDFDLPIKVKGTYLYNFFIGFLFGLFLFFVTMKGGSTTGDNSESAFYFSNWGRFVLAQIAGLVASFGIKKPFW